MKTAEARQVEKLLDEKGFIVASRLFQERSLEGVVELHREIQETIKIKNLQLRKLFFSKYLELINCSQLIDDLSGFARTVEDTAAQISKHAEAYQDAPVEFAERKDRVGVVERLVRRGRYFEAIVKCLEPREGMEVMPNQAQMLGILEVDIVEKVMLRLSTHFELADLETTVKTLTAFVYFAAKRYRLENANYVDEYGSSVGLLMNSLPQGRDSLSLAQSLTTALKVVFYLASTGIRTTSSKADICSFVEELERIVSLSETRLKELHGQLSQEWRIREDAQRLAINLRNQHVDCFSELHRSLAKAMIIVTANKKVTFNHSLYQDILKDATLLKRLERLEQLLGSTVTFESILSDLWNDFYQQMVDAFITGLDILPILKRVVKGAASSEELPPEIKRHTSNRTPTLTLDLLRRTGTKLAYEFEQLREVLSKGAASHSKQMKDHLVHRLGGWLNRTVQSIQQLALSAASKQRIALIVAIKLLSVLVADRLKTLREFDEGNDLRGIDEQLARSLEGVIDSQLEQLIQEDSKGEKTVEQRMLLLENRFMEYVPLTKIQSQLSLLKELVLKALEAMDKSLHDRDIEKVRYTRRYLLGTAEEISTFSCLFNFLPKHLFSLPHEPQHFNRKVLEDLLRQQKAPKRSFAKRQIKTAAAADRKELFDIGQTGSDVLKFASKFSNSIVGLIKGMSN